MLTENEWNTINNMLLVICCLSYIRLMNLMYLRAK